VTAPHTVPADRSDNSPASVSTHDSASRRSCQVPGLVEAGLSPADALPDGVVGVVERLVLSGWDEAEFAV
jgi:hypothetical protein